MTDTDHVARLREFADAWRDSDARDSAHSPAVDGRRYFGNSWFQVPGTDTKLTEPQLRAALDELEQLRTQHLPALGNAYAVGWTDAIGAVRTPGWAEREAGWKRFLGEVGADPEVDAKAKFAADMERLRKTDPGGAQWVEQILSERIEREPELPDRQAKLLAAMRREGGDFSPLRARTELLEAGYAVTSERAHQIMKKLAERGYLEQVRPRAYTYRLKAEASQQSEPDAPKPESYLCGKFFRPDEGGLLGPCVNAPGHDGSCREALGATWEPKYSGFLEPERGGEPPC